MQKQLESLLQPRPNQLRRGAQVTEARHHVLRDCRGLYKARRTAKPTHTKLKAEHERRFRHSAVVQEWDESALVPPSGCPGPSWTWPEFVVGSADKASAQGSDYLDAYFSRFPFKDMQTVDLKDLHRFNYEIEGPLSVSPSKLSHELEASTQRSALSADGAANDEWILLYSRISHIQSEESPIHMLTPPAAFHSTEPVLEVPGCVNDTYALGQFNFELTTPATEPQFAEDGHSVRANFSSADKSGGESRLSVGGRSSQWSLPTIKSLNRRLSSKYSESTLDDVVSLLECHTISGRSATVSSARTSQASSQKSSRYFSMQSDITMSASSSKKTPIAPAESRPPVVLPGAFHLFCWAQIEQNSLGLCRRDGLFCEHNTLVTTQFFTSQFGHLGIIYRRIKSRDINETDLFGNTILHVAASLCAPVQYITRLIKQHANIHATNTAGETFLHLLHAPTEEDDVCALIEELSIQGFDFSQQDDHGQTSLHLLTRPWHPQQYLTKVIKKFNSLGLPLRNSRDNLGFSLSDQMNNPPASDFDLFEDSIFRQSLGLTSDSRGCIIHRSPAQPSENSVFESNQCSTPDKRVSISTILDSPRYGHHADLLKTIITAGEIPWFEDSNGRNGLHCLAEVNFDLPLPNRSGCGVRYCGKEETIRELYLDNLLGAGVDSNNYDKEGNTPIMAFITHKRTSEDDNTTTRILTKLVVAKAKIHRRNRQGETALHLAVKLGRRAATKFLLKNGANVHARNKRGEGILEVGHSACRKALGDATLYAQIVLCMSLAISSEAVSSPTILREWTMLPTG